MKVKEPKECQCGAKPFHHAHTKEGDLVTLSAEVEVDVEELGMLFEAQIRRQRNTEPN